MELRKRPAGSGRTLPERLPVERAVRLGAVLLLVLRAVLALLTVLAVLTVLTVLTVLVVLVVLAVLARVARLVVLVVLALLVVLAVLVVLVVLGRGVLLLVELGVLARGRVASISRTVQRSRFRTAIWMSLSGRLEIRLGHGLIVPESRADRCSARALRL